MGATGIGGQWTAGDLKALRARGLPIDRLASMLEKSSHSIRRILSRPDTFIVDVPPSREVAFLACYLGKSTDGLDWDAMQHRSAWKAGGWKDPLHRTMDERLARPMT